MKRVVLDQALPATTAAILRDEGWDAVHVREITMHQAAEARFLTTPPANLAWLSRWIETSLRSSR